MEQDIASLLTRVESYKDTHPNLAFLWTFYLKEKQRSIQNTIEECKIALSKIDTLPDMTPSTILTLYCLENLETQL